MKRLISELYLNLIAGVIALGILALSAYTLWTDRLHVAGRRNLLPKRAHRYRP